MPWAYIDHRQVNIDEKIIDMLSLGSSSIYFRYAQIRYLDVAFGKPNRYISFGNVFLLCKKLQIIFIEAKWQNFA